MSRGGLALVAPLLRTPRYEVLPTPSAEESVLEWVPCELTITVTASPSRGLEPTLALTERLCAHGYTTVPHLSARLVRDRAHLAEIVARLTAAGVDDVFVPAGDADPPVGCFPSALTLLDELTRLGRPFSRVGITGYPESHPRIGDDITVQAMWDKRHHASYIVSNLCFDPVILRKWITRVRARGVTLPVLVGLAGPLERTRLLRMAAVAGASESARFLAGHAEWLVRLGVPGGYSPERLLARAAPTLADPAAGVEGLHLFTFNQVQQTERWRREVLLTRGTTPETPGSGGLAPRTPMPSARTEPAGRRGRHLRHPRPRPPLGPSGPAVADGISAGWRSRVGSWPRGHPAGFGEADAARVPFVTTPRIAIGPTPREWAVQAVRNGGGEPVGVDSAADALVWLNPADVDGLGKALAAASSARWVQLPFAGVERVAAAGLLDSHRTWTCAKGAYAEPVAEHALMLALAGLRGLRQRILAHSWGKAAGESLYDLPVTILGGGGIATSLLELLAPLRADVTVVRRQPGELRGAARTLQTSQLHEALARARVVFVALALTPSTEHIIGAAELAAMRPDAWLVNVARGRHVDTAALVTALRERVIGGAALDVTDPEPLPDGHPLWDLDNCIITPHTADTEEMIGRMLARRIQENVAAFVAREPLIGVVDPAAGY